MPASSIEPALVGYCTNVHPGTDLATIRKTLADNAGKIARMRIDSGLTAGPLPVGLWIPASAAGELIADDSAERFADWMTENHLTPLTINGFPFDNFHLPVVKHRVYRPAWWESSRLDYTVRLAELLDRMMTRIEPDRPKRVASISTLPIGWPGPLGVSRSDTTRRTDAERTAAAGANLRQLADELEKIEERGGRRVVVAIEPEPGCVLDSCDDIVDFFGRELPDPVHRRYLTVCHDVCHSAVMFESQSDALAAYARSGIGVGKVQISSAIDVPLSDYTADQRRAAIAELGGFAEDRYLHQTGVTDAAGRFRLVEDLPQWLSARTPAERDGELGDDHHLRIHFHVPIFRRSLGHLRSTQDSILECVDALRGPTAPDFTGHYEVETYAWTVLPESHAPATLADGIAEELRWFESALGSIGR